MTAYPDLVCPACRGDLRDGPENGLRCDACDRTYPVVAGIPDLRLVPDRYLSFDDDRAKARRLDDVPGGFREAVEAYWAMTPEVPPDLAARFAANTGNGIVRGAADLAQVGPVGPGDVLLDVGCGTGGLLAAAASRGATVVGIDTALRWLVIARRYLDELGVDALLVAADGATPPFRAGSFTVVTGVEVLEHAPDQRGLVNACLGLVPDDGGRVLLVTANRFTAAPEPAVRLWGVGLLPRRLAVRYVEARRRTAYRFTRPVSLPELRALVGPRDDVEVGPAPLPPAPAGASAPSRLLRAAAGRVLTHPRAAAVTPFLAVRRTGDRPRRTA